VTSSPGFYSCDGSATALLSRLSEAQQETAVVRTWLEALVARAGAKRLAGWAAPRGPFAASPGGALVT